jgi:hypothetical protein
VAVDVPKLNEYTPDYYGDAADYCLRQAHRGGLLKTIEPWMAPAALEGVKLYRNQVYHSVAGFIAISHPWALSTLKAAPIIAQAAFGANSIGSAFRDREAFYIAGQFGQKVARGDKLAKILADYHMPLQMRAITGHALAPSRWKAVWQLRHIKPSTLAQIIPPAKGRQNTWLFALQSWIDHCSRRPGDRAQWFAYEWAAKALSKAVRYGMDITTVADFAIACRFPNEANEGRLLNAPLFNLDWTWEQAQAAAERWHRDIAQRGNQQKFFADHGIGWDTPIDYAPFPSEVKIGRYTIVALRSGADLFLEGKMMRHCVGSYSADVIKHLCWVFSIRDGDRRVATFDIVDATNKIPHAAALRWAIPQRSTTWPPQNLVVKDIVQPPALQKAYAMRQCKGPCNAPPSKETLEIVRQWFMIASGKDPTKYPKDLDVAGIQEAIMRQLVERDEDGEF